MLEAYKHQFIDAVNAAWENYIQNTIVTVEMEAAQHREVVGDAIDYLWDRSAFPSASLDDVYPRPAVSFAAKNKPLANIKTYSYFEQVARIAAIAFFVYALVTGFTIWYFKNRKTEPMVEYQEEKIEVLVYNARKKVNIFKRNNEKKQEETLL